jgi:GTP-binding protein
VLSAKFIVSAASAGDFPRTGLPEIALVGRSNVGKSSLINALTRGTIARTSAAPGKTRLANYYLIRLGRPASGLYLVDLPGYGYARGGRESVEAFRQLTKDYFDPSAREPRTLAGILHLIDARHPDLPQDAAGHEWLLTAQAPIAIVVTKVDKLGRSEQMKVIRAVRDRYDVPVLPVSAVDGHGLDDVWTVIRRWIGPGA